MSNITSFPGGRSFQFLVKARHSNAPEKEWVSSFWAYSIAPGTIEDLYVLANALRSFIRYICLPSVEIGDVRVSSGAHDGNPYDPNTFTVIDYAWQPGLRAGAQGDALTVQAVLWIARAVAVGRQGNLYVRGVLAEGDVWAQAGKWVLQNATALGTLVADAVNVAGLGAYFLNGSSTVLRLALITSTGAFVRSLLGLSVKGVNILKVGHRYFDRGPATVGPSGHVSLPAPAQVLAEEAEVLGFAGTWTPINDTTQDQPVP